MVIGVSSRAATASFGPFHRRFLVVGPLSGHGSDVHKVKFSSDGTWLVTVSFDALARLWKLTTGKCVHVP